MALCPGPSWLFAFVDALCRVSRLEPGVVCKTGASPTPDGGTNNTNRYTRRCHFLELFSLASEAKDIGLIPTAPRCSPDPHSTSLRARPPFTSIAIYLWILPGMKSSGSSCKRCPDRPKEIPGPYPRERAKIRGVGCPRRPRAFCPTRIGAAQSGRLSWAIWQNR